MSQWLPAPYPGSNRTGSLRESSPTAVDRLLKSAGKPACCSRVGAAPGHTNRDSQVPGLGLEDHRASFLLSCSGSPSLKSIMCRLKAPGIPVEPSGESGSTWWLYFYLHLYHRGDLGVLRDLLLSRP